MQQRLVWLADRIDWARIDWARIDWARIDWARIGWTRIGWTRIDDQVADCFSAEGRPGAKTRLRVGILRLKQIYGLSDESVWERWLHDSYFQ